MVTDQLQEMRSCALILGGYVNGLAIINELHACGVRDIVLFDSKKSIAYRSRKVKQSILVPRNPSSLLNAIQALMDTYDRVILFPTDDLYLEHLNSIHSQLDLRCILPFNPDNLMTSLNKSEQYAACQRVGTPFPKSWEVCTREDLAHLETLTFPLLIKPNKRDDINSSVFRSLQLPDARSLDQHLDILARHLDQGIQFLASEIIPGDGSNIFAYACYRTPDGRILNEWTGKKLSQFPNDFGVFATASNQAPDIISTQGRQLVEAMDLHGFLEPEFKFDARDGSYKLMEINLRSMMWNRIGHLSGVNLHYTQYLHALAQDVPRYQQDKTSDIRLTYFKHELINLLTRRGYAQTFFRNLVHRNIHFSVFDLTDPLPFITDLISTTQEFARSCQKALKIRFASS